MSLRSEIRTDLQVLENDLGNPSFLWQGNSYVFIPSITDFSRELETGGFKLVRLMTATVRTYTVDQDNFTPVFASGLPTAQQKITYNLDGTTYRIESVKLDPTNSYFRLTAHSTTFGL